MANIIRHKRSDVPGSAPTAEDLFLGELALNTADGKLFTKKSDGTVVDLTTTGGLDGGELQYNSLLEGLMAFWVFSNNSGRVDDVSGNGKTFYEAHSQQRVQGVVGPSLRLDKRNFYYCQDALSGRRTISFWLKLDSPPRGAYDPETSYSVGDVVSFGEVLWRLESPPSSPPSQPDQPNWTSLGSFPSGITILSFGDDVSSLDGERIYVDEEGFVKWNFGNIETTLSSFTPMQAGQWRHFAFVRDSSTNLAVIYDNGVAPPLGPLFGGSLPASSVAVLGAECPIPLDLDCAGIWNRALSPSEVQTLYGGGAGYEFAEPQKPQIDIERFITVNVEGAISSLSAGVVGNSNQMRPAFDPAFHDYGILTSAVPAGTPVTFSVTVNGVSYPAAGTVGGLVRVTNGTQEYYIRLLPSDIPFGTVTTPPGEGYVPGWYVATSRRDVNVNNYNIIYDERGVPVWYVSNPGTPHLAQPGNDRDRVVVSRNGVGIRYLMDITNGSIDARQLNFLPTNRNGNSYQYDFGNHELLEVKSPPDARGNVIYNTFVTTPANGSQALTDKAYGVYVQEQSPEGAISWEWWTSDRFDQGSLARNASFFHMNSVDIHPVTGDMLMSLRQCSAIICVDRATKDVKWVIQGASQPWGNLYQVANQHTVDNANWLTLEGEPEINGYQYLGPEGQHHARWAINVDPLTPGNEVISVFDNQAGFFPGGGNIVPKTVTAMSKTDTTVTGTATSHGFTTGSWVKVTGADQAVFNGIFQVTAVNSSTFTYTVAESGSLTATGAIRAVKALTYWPHSASSPAARGVVYEIDLANGKAIHRASAFAPNGTSGYLGSYHIMQHDDGSFSHVLDFNQQHPQLVEYADGGDGASPGAVIFAVDFPGDIYRIIKTTKDQFDIEYLRATAGLTPTVLN